MKYGVLQIETEFGAFRKCNNTIDVVIYETGQEISMPIPVWAQLTRELPEAARIMSVRQDSNNLYDVNPMVEDEQEEQSAKVEADSLSAVIREGKYGQEEQN